MGYWSVEKNHFQPTPNLNSCGFCQTGYSLKVADPVNLDLFRAAMY